MERFKRHFRIKKSGGLSPDDGPPTNVSSKSSPQAETIIASPSNALRAPAIDATSSQKSDANARKGLNDFFPGGRTLGLRILHTPEKAVIDVVILHGLNGHPFYSWTHANGVFWPVDLLKDDVPGARIMAFGYDANVTKLLSGVGQNRISDHARSFLGDLGNVRAADGSEKRKIILVAHSLGGLLAKRAICISQTAFEPVEQQLDHNILAIAFLGTPHLGSDQAKYATVLARIVSMAGIQTNKNIVSLLTRDSEALAEIDEAFSRWLRLHTPPLKVTCFHEEKELPILGKVVDTQSARLSGQLHYSIPANHMDMTKFADRDDIGYQRVSREVRKWLLSLDCEGTEDLKEPLEEQMKECLRTLAYPDMHLRRENIEAPAEGTCDWCFETPSFSTWIDSGGLLWIKGKAGSGKSTLMRHIVKEFDVSPKASGGPKASFFFHGLGSDMQRSSIGLFRSLLHQICLEVPGLLTQITRKYLRNKDDIGEIETKWHWTEQYLQEALLEYFGQNPHSERLWIFVDALDEANEVVPKGVVKYFERLTSASSPGPKVSICFSCRHYPIISWQTPLELTLEANNAHDISRYVQQKLGKTGAGDMCQTIEHNANGTFLWARIVTDQVLDGLFHKTPKEIMDELQELPQELDEIYLRVLRGIAFKGNMRTLRLLQWICFASRPLRLPELRVALVLDIDRPQRTLEDLYNADDFIKTDELMSSTITARSAGLAEVVRDPHYEGDSLRYVRLIHQSVKDFLIEKGFHLLAGWERDQAIGISNHFLSRACIRYLQCQYSVSPSPPKLSMLEYPPYGSLSNVRERPIDRLSRLREGLPIQNPRQMFTTELFLAYAVSHWPTHAAHAEQNGVDQRDLVQLLDGPTGKKVFQMWRTGFELSFRRHAGEVSPVYNRISGEVLEARHTYLTNVFTLVAKLGFHTAIKAGLSSGRIDTMSKRSLAYLASYSRQKRMMELLIGEKGVDFNFQDRQGRGAIHILALSGQVEMMSTLLNVNDVDVNSQDSLGRTALHVAVEIQDATLTRCLLDDRRVDPNFQQGYKLTTPLQKALADGALRVAEILLERSDINLDAKDRHGNTVLHYATRLRLSTEFILHFGRSHVLLNEQNQSGRTPLHCAVCSPEVVRLLLRKKKINVSIKDNSGRTPLQIAVRDSLVETTKLLLEKSGGSVNTINYHGDTPLHTAARCSSVKIVQLLTRERSINLNVRNRKGQTPLHIAADLNLPHLFRPGNDFDTAKKKLQLLLQGATIDANAQDNEGRTPLHVAIDSINWLRCTRASVSERKDLSELFLMVSEKATASLDVEDKSGNIPLRMLRTNLERYERVLSQAVRSGYLGSAKALIKVESEAPMVNEHGYTVLHVAIKDGHLALVQLLLDGEVDIEARAIGGRTPLHCAARWGNLAIVKALVEAGGDLKSKDHCGRVSSEIAALGRHHIVENWLIEQEHNMDENSEGRR